MATETLEAPPVLNMDDAFDKAIAQQPTYDNAKMAGQDPNEALKAKEVVKPKEEDKALEALPKKDPLAKVETLTATVEPEDKDKKAQSRWMELKAAEKERDELRQWRAEQEKYRTEQEKKLKELEAKTWKEEERARFDELQKKERAWEVEATPEWKQQIEIPFKQRETYVNEVAKHFGIDSSALWTAMDEPHPFKRNEKIDELITATNEARIEKGEKPIASNFSGDLAKVGNEFQIIYSTMAQKRQEALELGTSLESQKAQMTEKQQAEQQEAYKKEYTDVRSELEKRLPALFGAKDLQIEGVSLAQAVEEAVPAEDARGKAYQAIAGEMLAFMTHRLKNVEAENATLKKEAAERAAASPGMQKTEIKVPAENKPEFASLEEAMAAQKRLAPQTMGM